MSRYFRNHDNDFNVLRIILAAGIAQYFMAGMGAILLILAGLATWRAFATGDGWVDYLLALPLAATGGIWAFSGMFNRYKRMQSDLNRYIRMTFKCLWAGFGALFALGALYLVMTAIF